MANSRRSRDLEMLRSWRAMARVGLERWAPRAAQRAIAGPYYAWWSCRRAAEAHEPDIAVARQLLREGETVIDGGANIGRFTVAFADAVGRRGHVLAIEPIERTYAILTTVVRLRRLTCVRARRLALSCRIGTVRMELGGSSAKGPNYYRARVVEGTSGINVPCSTLDALADELPSRPGLVKLDLEGHELSALRGARALLRGGPAVLFERSDDSDGSETARPVEVMLREDGYDLYWFDSSTCRLRPLGAGDSPVNVWALREAHLERAGDMSPADTSDSSA